MRKNTLGYCVPKLRQLVLYDQVGFTRISIINQPHTTRSISIILLENARVALVGRASEVLE